MSTLTLPASVAASSARLIQHQLKTWHLSVLIAAAYTLSLAILGSALHTSYGFPLDDSYIHQTVARNLARHGVLGFIPGVPSSGATSALWAFIQTLNYKLVHVDPVAFNLAISWGLLATIGVLLFSLAERDGLPRSHSFAFAVAPALSGNFMWLALIGMEHLLFVAITLACIYFWLDRQNARSALLAGLCAGLLALTRPEAMIFGPVLAVAGWKHKRAANDILSMLAAWVIFIAILFAVNLYTSHSLMPATLAGRTWLYFHSTGGPHSLRSILGFIVRWIVGLRLQFSVWHPGMSFVVFRVLIPLGLAVAGAVWLISRGEARVRLLFLFAAAHFCMFLLNFPAAGHGGRYQPLNLLLLFPCMFFGLLYLLQWIMQRQQIAAIVAAFALIAGGATSLRTWRIVSVDSIAHINNTHARVAQWLVSEAPQKAKVAVFDIGRISHDWDHPIIDLGGLVDPSYTPYLLNRRVPVYVKQQHADYLVLPSGKFIADLGFSPLSPSTILAEFCSPHDGWYIGWLYTGNAEQCQTIYKVP